MLLEVDYLAFTPLPLGGQQLDQFGRSLVGDRTAPATEDSGREGGLGRHCDGGDSGLPDTYPTATLAG